MTRSGNKQQMSKEGVVCIVIDKEASQIWKRRSGETIKIIYNKREGVIKNKSKYVRLKDKRTIGAMDDER